MFELNGMCAGAIIPGSMGLFLRELSGHITQLYVPRHTHSYRKKPARWHLRSLYRINTAPMETHLLSQILSDQWTNMLHNFYSYNQLEG